uniref:Uncharacterized protein n=1 Tax=Siphoviridae sp. ctGpg14 TaxID=2827824 RepID=A0A8S5T5R1_9CAUD|nr:MAG TPA: hypothetical protein [Siphoviridae sp. ctGpg14]
MLPLFLKICAENGDFQKFRQTLCIFTVTNWVKKGYFWGFFGLFLAYFGVICYHFY